MAKIQISRNYPGKSAGDVYQAVLKAAPKAGLTVWKRRDIAWLAMVRCGTGKDAVDGNVSVRPGAAVTVSFSSEADNEAGLREMAESVFGEINKALG